MGPHDTAPHPTAPRAAQRPAPRLTSLHLPTLKASAASFEESSAAPYARPPSSSQRVARPPPRRVPGAPESLSQSFMTVALVLCPHTPTHPSSLGYKVLEYGNSIFDASAAGIHLIWIVSTILLPPFFFYAQFYPSLLSASNR